VLEDDSDASLLIIFLLFMTVPSRVIDSPRLSLPLLLPAAALQAPRRCLRPSHMPTAPAAVTAAALGPHCPLSFKLFKFKLLSAVVLLVLEAAVLL